MPSHVFYQSYSPPKPGHQLLDQLIAISYGSVHCHQTKGVADLLIKEVINIIESSRRPRQHWRGGGSLYPPRALC